MKYHFKVHKEGNKMWAECLELKGCYTQADSMKELYIMMEEALNLYISEPEDSTRLAKLPDDSIRKSKNVVEVSVDSEIAFSFLVRYHRIKDGMTQHQAAKKLGFENINSKNAIRIT
jgi:predicted RNase H-like HicB family nuclease